VLAREGFEVAPLRAVDSLDAVVFWAGDSAVEDALEIAERIAGAPVVLVASAATRRRVFDALSAGIRGFVAEEDVDPRLRPTVEAVVSGQVVVPAEHREALDRPLLTAREKQVLSMVVLGFTNGEIATKLYVTETTVKSHLSSSYRKLAVRSRQEATEMILDSRDGLGLGVLSLTPVGTAALEPVVSGR
jgi:DNA-binding NarL/FixJ family response regulator